MNIDPMTDEQLRRYVQGLPLQAVQLGIKISEALSTAEPRHVDGIEAFAAEANDDGTAAHVRQMLGISEASWKRFGSPPVAPEAVQAFAATAPGIEDLKECSEFLGRLATAAGMDPYRAMGLDALYFEVVRAPRNTRWENEGPGRYGPGPVEIEKAQKAMKDVLGLDDDSADPGERDLAAMVWDALMVFDRYLVVEQGRSGLPGKTSHIPFRPSIAEMLRAALFLAHADPGREWTGKEIALLELFFEYRTRHQPAD